MPTQRHATPSPVHTSADAYPTVGTRPIRPDGADKMSGRMAEAPQSQPQEIG